MLVSGQVGFHCFWGPTQGTMREGLRSGGIWSLESHRGSCQVCVGSCVGVTNYILARFGWPWVCINFTCERKVKVEYTIYHLCNQPNQTLSQLIRKVSNKV